MDTDPPPPREFSVTTSFQIEALKPGGLSREEALQKAEQNLAALRLDFPNALGRQIHELWHAARQARSGDPASREQLKLKCTDLSDAATTIGYALVAYVAASLRDACESRTFETHRDEIVACHVDAMHLCGTDAYRNRNVADVPELTVGLRRIMKRG